MTRSLDIAAVAGALSLMPDNASHEGALFALLRAASSDADRRRLQSPSQAQVRSLLQQHPGPKWDSPETLFTTRIPFHGGDHLALTGGYLGLDTAVEHLLASLFLHRDAPPDALAREAFQLTAAVLRLGDHVVPAAGLRRHEPCGTSRDVVVPATPDLRPLLRAVSFTRREVEDVTRVGAEALEPLVVEAADVQPGDDGTGAFGVTPILRDGDRYLLAAPTCLLLALRHHLVLLARRHRWSSVLADRLLSHGARMVDASLERFGWEQSPLAPARQPMLPVAESLWAFDDGSALVTVVGDDLTNYSEGDPEAPWNVFYRHRQAVSERRDTLAATLYLGEAPGSPPRARGRRAAAPWSRGESRPRRPGPRWAEDTSRGPRLSLSSDRERARRQDAGVVPGEHDDAAVAQHA